MAESGNTFNGFIVTRCSAGWRRCGPGLKTKGHTSSWIVDSWLRRSQLSTLSKGRNFNAKLVRHCCRFWQQSRTLLRYCCWCGPGFTYVTHGARYGRSENATSTVDARRRLHSEYGATSTRSPRILDSVPSLSQLQGTGMKNFSDWLRNLQTANAFKAALKRSCLDRPTD